EDGPRCDVRGTDQLEQFQADLVRRVGRTSLVFGDRLGRPGLWRFRPLANVVLGRVVGERLRREGRDDLVPAPDLEPLVRGDLADADAVQLPASEDALDVGLAPGAGDDE